MEPLYLYSQEQLTQGVWFIETLDAVDGKIDELAQGLLQLVPLSRQELKCLVYDLYQDELAPHHFTVIMCFTDQTGYHEHIQSSHIERFVQQFPEGVVYTNVVERQYKRLS